MHISSYYHIYQNVSPTLKITVQKVEISDLCAIIVLSVQLLIII